MSFEVIQMKKFFAMAVFALSVFILQMPQAAAEDVYVGEWEGGWKGRNYFLLQIERRFATGSS